MTVIKIIRVNELFIQWKALSVMAVSFIVMGQRLTQFGSSDVEVEVDVKVLNNLVNTARLDNCMEFACTAV